MPTSNAEELRLFLKCTVIGRGVFGPCACCQALFEGVRSFRTSGADKTENGWVKQFYLYFSILVLCIMSHCLIKTNLGMSNLGNNSYKDKQASFWKKNAKTVPGKLVFFFWEKFFFLPSSSWLVTYQDAHKNDESQRHGVQNIM